MQMQCNHSTDRGFWLRVWSQVRDGPPAGSLLCTAARCHMPVTHLHTYCTAGRLGLACRGWCCRITLHSASVVRLIARPCLVRFLSARVPAYRRARECCLAGRLTGHVSSTVQFELPPALPILFAKQAKQTKLQPVGQHAASDAISWALAQKLVRVVNKYPRLDNCGYFPVQGNTHASWWGNRLAVRTVRDGTHINTYKCVIHFITRISRLLR